MPIRRTSLACFIFSAFCSVTQASAQQAPAMSPQHDDGLLEGVSSFLIHFIDPAKTPEQQAALFSRDAQYYEYGKVGKAAIIRDVQYFSRRWPYRDYRLSNIHYITADPASDRLFVSYEIDYRVANRNKTVSGTARYGAVLVNHSGSPKIEWIKEKVGND